MAQVDRRVAQGAGRAGLYLRRAVVLSVLAVLGTGCASRPAPLPAVRPEAMPEAWIDLLTAAPCPVALEARVAMRVDAPGQPGVNLDGTLKFASPGRAAEASATPGNLDHQGLLKLDARLGVFRPIFNLIAKGEAAQLLIHEERASWVTPRGQPDWEGMNPSAWATAVGWALCPGTLLRALQPDGVGKVEGDIWSLRGVLRESQAGGQATGSELQVEVRVDRVDRSVQSIQLQGASGSTVTAQLENYRYYGEAWIPTVVNLSFPQPDGRLELRAILKGLSTPDPEILKRIDILQPPGWIEVTRPMALPIPTESGPAATP